MKWVSALVLRKRSFQDLPVKSHSIEDICCSGSSWSPACSVVRRGEDGTCCTNCQKCIVSIDDLIATVWCTWSSSSPGCSIVSRGDDLSWVANRHQCTVSIINSPEIAWVGGHCGPVCTVWWGNDSSVTGGNEGVVYKGYIIQVFCSPWSFCRPGGSTSRCLDSPS